MIFPARVSKLQKIETIQNNSLSLDRNHTTRHSRGLLRLVIRLHRQSTRVRAIRIKRVERKVDFADESLDMPIFESELAQSRRKTDKNYACKWRKSQEGMTKKKKKEHSPNQLLQISSNTPATNLQHGKRAILRLVDMPHAQDALVDRLDALRERVRLRQLEVRRQRLAVGEAGGQQREDGGDLVRGAVGVGDQAAEIVRPLRVVGRGLVG